LRWSLGCKDGWVETVFCALSLSLLSLSQPLVRLNPVAIWQQTPVRTHRRCWTIRLELVIPGRFFYTIQPDGLSEMTLTCTRYFYMPIACVALTAISFLKIRKFISMILCARVVSRWLGFTCSSRPSTKKWQFSTVFAEFKELSFELKLKRWRSQHNPFEKVPNFRLKHFRRRPGTLRKTAKEYWITPCKYRLILVIRSEPFS
jgi:hypothetical protein